MEMWIIRGTIGARWCYKRRGAFFHSITPGVIRMLSHVRLSKRVVMMIITAAFSSTFLLAGENDSRPLLSLGFFASNYDPGWIVKMDTAGGYRFGRHFEFTAGVPVYFVRFPEGELEDTSGSKTGIGNVYMNLRAMAEVSGFYFSSSVRAAAPTGDEEEGFSTGRMTVDWNNYFEYDAGFLVYLLGRSLLL